jgi:hypothetical protein
MIRFKHRHSAAGWYFDSADGNLTGCSRSLVSSKDNAEHAARQYLSSQQGYAVHPDDARDEVEHLVRDEHALAWVNG